EFAAALLEPQRSGAVALELDDLDRAVIRCLGDVFVEVAEVSSGIWFDDAICIVRNLEYLRGNVFAELAGDAAFFDPDLLDGGVSHGALLGGHRVTKTGREQVPSSGGFEIAWIAAGLSRPAGRSCSLACRGGVRWAIHAIHPWGCDGGGR